MEQIGIRALKAKLSEYVRKAAAGEIIEVTERGRVVAQLRAPGPVAEAFPYPELLRAASEGKVKMPRVPVPSEVYLPRQVTEREGVARAILDELRGDR